jgi:hypothetical protein
MALNIQSLSNIVLPKRRANPKGSSSTSTFNPQQTDQVLSAQDYRAHLVDLFTDRASLDSRELLNKLFKYDSDISATVHAYLTLSNTTPIFSVYNMDDELDRDGLKGLEQIIRGLTTRSDYSTGFQFTHKIEEIAEQLRYMILLRGGICAELVFDKFLVPAEVRHIDLATVNWYEKAAGQYKPEQEPPNANDPILLDLPNIFVKHYRQNPAEIYSESPFVSSINTVAARQQVINDLYRIMQKTGYPRMEVTVVEEVLMKNAPENIRQDPNQMRAWMNARLTEIANGVANLRPDAAYIHFDAVEAKILNEGGPAKSLDASDIMKVLDAQNQAALKTMGTIIGKGESGVNTASVEARVFSMSADSINVPIASMFEDMFTLALRLQGFDGYVKCKFAPAELRPDLELEPQRIMKQTRLLGDLSVGIITDDEYHMNMYNRPKPDSAPELSGTNFQTPTAGADAESVSPNSDPLGRSVASEGSTKQARSNEVKK